MRFWDCQFECGGIRGMKGAEMFSFEHHSAGVYFSATGVSETELLVCQQ